ncbi:MAG: phosphate--acyl-ACP acyltransferase [Candidatus Omnitrophica bacterium CG11_big_fil_rev_8_21_14_0_20_63_9]|nr:MAG: phosphate--acyl-ACP acyltransferase [Candidatus Omnitrophica bacterium CG11_big_fil_rev_8_21_14_0_20_63_9]
MKIALDAMGGDAAPETPVAGAVRAAREFPLEIILVGQQDAIQQQLGRYPKRPSNISIVHAPDVIGMDESPAASIRKKRESSITIGVELLKDKKVDAFVSAGNTGAVVSASTLLVGLLPGIERPGIAIILPGVKGDTLLIDVGANIDPKPMHLLQYALMGESYARYVMGKARPTLGLLNVGEEESKGTDFIKETYGLLEGSGVNFVGNVEGHDIFSGEFDVIVCDGFAGNIALKTAESLAHAINVLLKRSLMMSPITRLGAFLARDAFVNLRREVDYAERGGAPLLGVDGISIIAHGASSGKAIKNAIRVAYESVRHDLNKHVVEAVNLYTQHAKEHSA